MLCNNLQENKRKLEMCPIGTHMPGQVVMLLTQNDFRDASGKKENCLSSDENYCPSLAHSQGRLTK